MTHKYIPTPEELASGNWVWDDVAKQFIHADELTEHPEEIIPEPVNQENLILRQAAYRAVSDPLYMEWQYDKTREAELAWRAAVKAIKKKFPLH